MRTDSINYARKKAGKLNAKGIVSYVISAIGAGAMIALAFSAGDCCGRARAFSVIADTLEKYDVGDQKSESEIE